MTGPLDLLPERATRMVDQLAVAEQDDAAVIAVMRATGDELDSAQATAETIRDQAWPMRADDQLGILALHEAMLGMPISPATGLAQRRAAVAAAVQGRRVGSKANWRKRLDTALRGLDWNYDEDDPGPGELTISIPYAPTSFTSALVARLAERITPAHLVIHINHFVSGFEPDYAFIRDNYRDYAEVAATYENYEDLTGIPE